VPSSCVFADLVYYKFHSAQFQAVKVTPSSPRLELFEPSLKLCSIKLCSIKLCVCQGFVFTKAQVVCHQVVCMPIGCNRSFNRQSCNTVPEALLHFKKSKPNIITSARNVWTKSQVVCYQDMCVFIGLCSRRLKLCAIKLCVSRLVYLEVSRYNLATLCLRIWSISCSPNNTIFTSA
jgi:hypothetical protein